MKKELQKLAMALNDAHNIIEPFSSIISVSLIDKGFYRGATIKKLVSEQTLDIYEAACMLHTKNDVECHAEHCGTLIHNFCPRAKIVSIDVFDKENWAKSVVIAAAIKWASHQGIQVIFVGMATNSIADADILEPACKFAIEHGSIVIAPVDNLTSEGYPAMFETVVSVIASDTIDACKPVWLEQNNVNIVADGVLYTETNDSKQKPIPKSSYAAARCAGIIADLWSRSPSAKNSDILNQFKQNYGRRKDNYYVYIGGRRVDLGGWQRIANLRSKQLLFNKYDHISVQHALQVGDGFVCRGMPLVCRVSLLESNRSKNVRNQTNAGSVINKLWSTVDSIIIASGSKRADARDWIYMAQKNRKNIIVTTKRLTQLLQHDLVIASENGCNVWAPSVTVLPAPRWHFRKQQYELPNPCIMVVSNCAEGATLGLCKEQLNIVANQNNHKMLWMTDMPDGWLAGFNMCVPINEIGRECGLPLDIIMGAIHHEVRRRVHETGAKVVGAIVTKPLLFPRLSGQIMVSPWTQAFLGICSPRTIVIVSGSMSPKWLEVSYVSNLLAQMDISHIGIVRNDKERVNGISELSEINEVHMQAKPVEIFGITNRTMWQQFYQFTISDRNA